MKRLIVGYTLIQNIIFSWEMNILSCIQRFPQLRKKQSHIIMLGFMKITIYKRFSHTLFSNQITKILLMKWLIEMKLAFDILLNFGRNLFLRIERAARSCVEQ